MITGNGPRIVALLALLAPVAAADRPEAKLKVTQRYLQPLCLDGAPVKAGERSWKLDPGEHTLAFTMGGSDAKGPAGVAAVSFTAEAGHKYEVEVRAAPTSFSLRSWKRGEWKPVVRDRTPDHIVSGEPQWSESGCPAPAP